MLNLNALKFVRKPGNQVYFNDIASVLVAHILEAEYVYGCVAWLSHVDVLTALKQKKSLIVVQQEDWKSPARSKAFQSYSELTPIPFEYLNLLDPKLNRTKATYASPAVRAIGSPEGSANSHPRMHHKFLILEKSNGIRGVWSGSFNMTHNATNSLENAMFVTDEHVVKAYQEEFMNLFRISGELSEVWEPGKYYTYETKLTIIEPYQPDLDYIKPELAKPILEPIKPEPAKPIKLEPVNPILEPIKLEPAKPILEPAKVPTCSECGKFGHKASQCLAKVPCTYCGIPGHLVEICSKKKKDEGKPMFKPCPACGLTNHTYAYCFKNPNRKKPI